MHPLQCLGAVGAEQLAGSRARVEGDRRGRAAASRLARDLGLRPLRWAHEPDDADRAAYHAAAALASNDLVALLDHATELLERGGLSRRDALGALAALARGTLAEIEHGGICQALSGPVARGDAQTVAAHLERLAAHSDDLLRVHRRRSAQRLRVGRRETGRAAPRAVTRLLREPR